jgi:hypothetical protein
VHRIIEGENGGKYSEGNCLCTCVGCHRRIHDGQIVIQGKYLCSNGRHVVIYHENGEEKMKEC